MNIKNILFVCQYAQEPPYNTMLRYHNFAKHLVKQGYSIDILTSSKVHNTNTDLIDVYGNDHSNVDGVDYHYIKTSAYQGNGVKRLLNMYQFCRTVRKYKKTFKPDCVLVCGAYLYSFVKKTFKNVPIILDIVDLWPQSIVEYANKSSNHPFIKYLYRIERKAYFGATALIFSMEGGVDYIHDQKYKTQIDETKIFHINMGCDISDIDFNKENYSIPLELNNSLFNVGYCGSIRKANNIKQICDAAKLIKEKGFEKIFFNIFGNGDELEELEKYCQDNQIDNIKFYGRVEKNTIPYILSKMDVNIITYKQVNLMKYGGSQSKLFDYLSIGKPIICNCNFGYNLITRYNCGLVTKSQETDDFVSSIIEMFNLPQSTKEEFGNNSRKAAEKYDISILVDQLKTVLDFVAK